MISSEDRLRIYTAVQTELRNSSLAEVVCKLAETLGLERALMEFNRALAEAQHVAGAKAEGTPRISPAWPAGRLSQK